MEADTSMETNSSGRGKRFARKGLSGDLLYGMTPDEFGDEAKALADAEALTPQTRERLKHQLIQRLKTPVDPPSWGPDWARRWNKQLRKSKPRSRGWFSRKDKDFAEAEEKPVLTEAQHSDAEIIAENLEKSRQVSQYRTLYIIGFFIAVAIALLAMFVDYEIIRGDIWTRALSNEFMIVPESLKESVFFKSLQVVFAALAIHFMLKITGVYGRNTLISTAFVLTCIMVVCLGYLVAYNNMDAGTSARLDHMHDTAAPQHDSIDSLLTKIGDHDGAPSGQAITPAVQTTTVAANPEFSLPVPKLSEQSLANAQGWLWLAFASVIFFIVTTIAALYMQIAEHNVRNFLIARDYTTRRRQYAQLHLLEVAGAKA